MPDNTNHNNAISEFAELVRIMSRLRAPDGCPWDRAQTHDSLLKNLLEETYEFVDAVNNNDISAMREELGDLFLQLIFHGQIGEERGTFSLQQSLQAINDKLIRRHPHVFGDVKVSNPEEALDSWNNAKKSEGDDRFDPAAVPRAMPALMRARKVQDKAGRVGFEWPDLTGVFNKLEEELAEMRAAITSGDNEQAAAELGDVLFVLANVSRHIHCDAEVSLTKTTDKFIRRFKHIEKRLAERGLKPQDATLEVMDSFWDEAKELERRQIPINDQD